jgi:hypothetical protein
MFKKGRWFLVGFGVSKEVALGIALVRNRFLIGISVVRNRLPRRISSALPLPTRQLALSLKMFTEHFFNALS